MQNYNDIWLSHDANDDVEIRDMEMPLRIIQTIRKEDLDPKRYVMSYGKNKGKSLVEINETDSSYVSWLKENDDDLLLKQCIINL